MTTNQKSNEKRTPTTPVVESSKSGDFGIRHTSKAIRVIAIILLTVLIGAGYFGYSRINSQNSTSATDETTLQTARATVGDLILYANGTGTIIAATESSFGFNTNGQVSEIYVQVGDQVLASGSLHFPSAAAN